MIIITGAAGFIGSNLLRKLNDEGYYDIVLVDDFSRTDKIANYANKKYSHLVHREHFAEWLHQNHRFVEFVFHIGARTDTAEFDMKVFDRLNFNYSKSVFEICVEYGIPLIYASSAACYGMGELGYSDSHDLVEKLQALNPYGVSKLNFDKWVLQQNRKPYFWAGIRFFNVYGPNEYHKSRMASVIFHAFRQIEETGKIKLFRSHRSDVANGEQKRDFVYVIDAVDVLYYFMLHRKNSGIYNLGTGEANSFNNLAKATFEACGKIVNIEYIDTPVDIREKYQYYTCADIKKLRAAGYHKTFLSLSEGTAHYVKNFLNLNRYS